MAFYLWIDGESLLPTSRVAEAEPIVTTGHWTTVEEISLVDGRFLGGSDRLVVTNPATGQTIAAVGSLPLAGVEHAVVAARRAFDHGPWPRLAPRERAAAVLGMVEHLESIEERLVDTAVAETGCPRAVAAIAQVRMPLRQARELVDLFLALPEIVPNPVPLTEAVGPGRVTLSAIRHEPVGVVAAISAYNFSLYLNLWKTLPALLAGNTVVLRPSPLTPLTAFYIGEAAVAAGLPPGAVNVVVEAGINGAHLMTTHPAVDVVSFTGSTAVGRTIATQAAPTLKRVLLELGGKSVGLYLPEAIHRVAEGIRQVMVNHAGQACVAQTRVLVPNTHKQEALDTAAATVDRLTVGDPDDPAVAVGPVISAAQAARIAGIVDEARAGGASVVTGGARPTGLAAHLAAENFYAPTILDCPDQSFAAVREEIFGPVVCVLGYDDVEEAIELANDSTYALSAGVYGDPRAALDVAERLQAGTVAVNQGFASAYASSGGWKQSGAGRERGVEGLRAFQRIKHVAVSA